MAGSVDALPENFRIAQEMCNKFKGILKIRIEASPILDSSKFVILAEAI